MRAAVFENINHVHKRILLLLLFPVLLMTGCAAHTITSGRMVIRDDTVAIDVRFSDHDRVILQDYYGVRQKKQPPGLAKRESLPPGLGRRDHLPPGLPERSLPRELEARLSTLPATQRRIIIGQDVVLLQRESRVILDILYGVVN